jgi:hypothetical protein
LQAQKPPAKFRSLDQWLVATPETHRVWPTANWSITDSEIGRFVQVDTSLDHDIDAAMNVFADLVAARADRLLDTPFEMLPDAKLFAVDSKQEFPEDWSATDALPPELADRLGLSEIVDRFQKASPRSRDDGKPPPVPAERRPILDVPRQWGWPRGWRTEFAYVDFHDERWQEHNIKTLYKRTFKWLWEHRREALLRWSKEDLERSDDEVGLIAGPGHVGRWDRLDDEHYLQMGLFYRYPLAAVQDVLKALGLAEGVYVVYGDADN